MPEPCQIVVDRALAAYDRLTELGEDVEDEWSYVNDLAVAWRDRLIDLGARRGEQPAPETVCVAVDRAIAEIGLISDPHRAIDWLSTFPQVIALAFGEAP